MYHEDYNLLLYISAQVSNVVYFIETTRRYIPEGHHLHTFRRYNLNLKQIYASFRQWNNI
jgi:hypothetical protein